MKNFLQHLTETQKTYEFRIKIADIDPSESIDRLKNALEAYGLESLSSAKRLPIKDNDIDFPSIKNCQIYLLDVILTYPVNDQQLRAIIADRADYPASNIVVVPKNHPEEIWRWNIDGASELREYKPGESVLDKPYSDDECASAEEASKQYVEAGSLLKELSKANWEVAGKEKADGKTTNELPQGNDSPIGSKQNNIPSVAKGK